MAKRELTAAESREILSLKKEDITMTLLRNYFAVKKGQDNPRFNTFDTFTLLRGYYYNDETIVTTVGRYLVNLFILPDTFLKKFRYQNVTMDAGTTGDIEEKLAFMLLNDEISAKEYSEFLDNGEWMTLGLAYFLVPTMDYDMNVPIPEVIKRRDELFEQFAKEIAEGDQNVSNAIEKELLDMSKKLIKAKGNQGYDFFESGEFNFGNNYKKTSIMGGAVENPYTKKLDILKSNYISGIDKKEFPYFANLTVIGGYSRGVETQKAGYETKKINNALQVVVLDEPGTDCGTNHYLKITITDKMKNMYLYRNVLENGKLVTLTADNIGKYTGRELMMRSPMYCKTDKICSVCAGGIFYKLGMTNAGLLSSTMSGSLMNLSMKKFHDTTIKFSKLDAKKFITKR